MVQFIKCRVTDFEILCGFNWLFCKNNLKIWQQYIWYVFFFNLINVLFNNEKYNQNYLDGLDYVVDIPPRKEIQSKKIVEINHDYRQMSREELVKINHDYRQMSREELVKINHDYRQMSREKIKKRQSVSPKKVVFKE